MNNKPAKTLKKELEKQKAEVEKTLSTDILKIFAEGQKELAATAIEKTAHHIGDNLPEATLKNHLGEEVTLYNLLKKRTTVLTFYRGGWCPYCNLHLRAIQQALSTIKEQKAQLIAVSPESSDKSLSTKEKQSLAFTVLTDQDNQFAQKIGIAFQIPEAVKKTYLELGLTIEAQSNDPNVFLLPLAATYIVDSKGKIIWDFVNIDYTQRAEPKDIIDFLKTLS